MISDEAVEAALNSYFRGSKPVHPHNRADMRAALGAASTYLMADIEWGIFRASDDASGTPIENLRYKSREAAQRQIESSFNQPEYWEVRGRPVGAWDRSAGAGE